MSEWKSIQLGDHAEILSGFPFPSEGFSQEEGVPLIRIRDLLAGELETYFIGPYPDDFVIDDGDILIGMDGDFNIVRWTKGKALLNQRVCKVFTSTTELDDGYLFWLLEPELQDIHQKTPQTTVKHLSVRDLAQLRLEVPPVHEQRLIARILDALDTQIQKTEALIAKLEKVKEGLLHDLLTRGIDENGRLRPSPEWAPELYKESPLGTVPKKWKATTLGNVSKVSRGASPRPIDDPAYFSSQGRGWVRISDVTASYKYLELASQYLSPLGESKSVKVDPGDLIMSICASIGKPVIVDMPSCIHDGFVVFDIDKSNIEVEFMFYFLLWNKSRIEKEKQVGTQGNLNTSLVNAVPIGLPPIAEQIAISDRLKCLDNKLLSEKRELERNNLFKEGLMDDLLTGQVRVNPLLEQAEATTPA